MLTIIQYKPWMKIALALGVPLFLWAGAYVIWLSISEPFWEAPESLIYIPLGLLCVYVGIKGTSLLPFLFHKLELARDGIQIINCKNQTTKLKWSEIGKYRRHEILQIFKIYDTSGKLVYAVDFKAENFSLLPMQFQQRLPPIFVTGRMPRTKNRDELEEILKRYSLPYRVDVIRTKSEYESLMASVSPQRVVLVGGAHDVDNLSASLSFLPSSPEEILSLATTFDVNVWASSAAKASALEETGFSLGEWPMGISEPTPYIHPSRAENLLKQGTCAAVIPSNDSWSAPAYLPFADLDQCPAPHIHVALAKRWSEQFGAEIVAITSYTIEFQVHTPPAQHDVCEQLAWEHVLYAPECLGEQTIREYAHSLIGNTKWLFLWD